MNNFPKFILVGFIFAMVVEFHFNILATGNIGNFIFVTLFYPVYLSLVFLANNFIDKHLKGKKADVLFYLFFGFFGLAFEWFVIGNSPWGNPDANQIGMFSFWVALTFMPRIFINKQKEIQPLKKSVTKYFVAYTIVTTLIGFLLPVSFRIFFLTWFEVIGYTVMHYFYWKYYKLAKN
ncbi:MAG: hypothetical protein CL944_01835 [Candidatus Diapherotrites archaeon]|uniref:Uncharacterized protein n=1 Tax=Candidatus Iainarchaeum sp. TaxID=3101447 RepID=A0A2D6LQ05_9ARCH|nr:hypothetical protein [Candidatus Diapherotrites archaeon]|tara:strand:+ start:3942 stop:4475 length:534 start_codon:yes stop_codon:yes gene_type:complete